MKYTRVTEPDVLGVTVCDVSIKPDKAAPADVTGVTAALASTCAVRVAEALPLAVVAKLA